MFKAERMAAQEESQQLALQAMMNDLALQNGTNQVLYRHNTSGQALPFLVDLEPVPSVTDKVSEIRS